MSSDKHSSPTPFERRNEFQAQYSGAFRKGNVRIMTSHSNHRTSPSRSMIESRLTGATLGDVATSAILDGEVVFTRKPNPNFKALKPSPSMAINNQKSRLAALDNRNVLYKRQYTTNPLAPPSIGAKVPHFTSITNPGIRRGNSRAISAPPSNKQYYSRGEPNSRPYTTSNEPTVIGQVSQLAHPPGMPGNIPVKVQTAETVKQIRASQEDKTSAGDTKDKGNQFSISTIKESKEGNEKKPAEGGTELKIPGLGGALGKRRPSAWLKAKEKVTQFRQTDMATAHLCVLTDQECESDEIREALEELIEIARNDEAFTGTTLYDLGAVNILLDVLKRTTDSWELQQKCCELLLLLANNNELTLFTIWKHGGIMSLLKTVEIVGKATVDFSNRVLHPKGKTMTNAQLALGKFAKKKLNFQAQHKDLGSTTLFHADSENSLAKKENNNAPIPEISISTGEEGDMKDFKMNGNGNDDMNLLTGLLKEYFDPTFTEKIEKLDRNAKTQIIKHLLSVFERVDKLLSVTMYISLEVELVEAMSDIQCDAMDLVQAHTVKYYLVDQKTDELYVPRTKEEIEKGIVNETRFPPSRGIAGWSATYDETINIRDAATNELFDPDVDYYNFENGTVNSILCVPIKDNNGRVLGVLEAINKVNTETAEVVYFTDEDEFLLKILGRQAGLVIANAQIYETMLKTQKKVEVLLETTKSLGSTVDIGQLIKMIMDSAKELLDADRCTLFLADFEKKQLSAHIQGRDKVEEIRIHMNQGIAGYSFTSGLPVNIPDAYSDPRFNPQVDKQTGYVTKNILCMPISNISGQVIGVTQMINKFGDSFDTEDENILSSFSSQAAVAIEKSYLFKKTEDIMKYLESILSSITSCVITLSESLILKTMNRDWFAITLGVSEEVMRENPITEWLGDSNSIFLIDIQKVLQTGEPIYSAEYTLQNAFSDGGSKFINYQIMPLIGNENKGLVMVLEDISSEKRAIMTLGRYMSPALAKQVMEEDGSQLGGKRKKVAILFSDIRSFTTLTESMEPHMVVELLNHHFSDAVNAILAEQGILDKYIGDAVMAVFGVPFVSPEDSIHACNAALRMRAALKIANEQRVAGGKMALKIGIGLNTGLVLSGNIGSEKRMEFSCIGDAVNLGSRIEGLTKFYGVTILITEYTFTETGNNFWTREIDTVVVTGRSHPVKIYELLGRKPTDAQQSTTNDEVVQHTGAPQLQDTPHEEPMEVLPQHIQEMCQYYAQGLELYRRMLFQEAMESFSLAIEKYDDGPSKRMYDRCQTYLLNPPSQDSEMVYKCDSK